VRVLWRGVGATLAKDVPYAVIFWSVLEPARAALLPPPADGAPAPPTSALLAANAAAGMASGGLAAALTTPLDVAKARARRLHVDWAQGQGQGRMRVRVRAGDVKMLVHLRCKVMRSVMGRAGGIARCAVSPAQVPSGLC